MSASFSFAADDDDAEPTYRYYYTDASGNPQKTNNVNEVIKAVPKGGTLTVTDANGTQKDINDQGMEQEVRDKNGKILRSAKTAEEKKGSQASTDPCSISAKIGNDVGRDYRCGGTTTIIKGTEIGNAVAGTAGKTIINTIGQTTAAKSQNGSMSSGYQGSAKMAKTAFTYETTLTAMNMAATAALAKKTAQHKRNAQELEELRDKTPIMLGDTKGEAEKRRYDEAIKEQTGAQNKANAATFVTALKGVENLSNAMTSKKVQKDAEKAANLSKQIENVQNKPGVVWDTASAVTAGNFDPNQALAGGGTEGTGTEGGTSSSGDTMMNGSTNLLGNGQGLSDGDASGPEEHTPGSFKAAAGGAGGSGAAGGAGGGAAGGGSGGGGAGEESKAGYASEFGTKERYESGGAGGKGGSGKAGGKEDGGIDLNGLLAQFLPKTEEDLGPKNGILDFAGGGRAPAAAEEVGSYLDKNADLFQRIHETMSEKNRKGHVGI